MALIAPVKLSSESATELRQQFIYDRRADSEAAASFRRPMASKAAKSTISSDTATPDSIPNTGLAAYLAGRAGLKLRHLDVKEAVLLFEDGLSLLKNASKIMRWQYIADSGTELRLFALMTDSIEAAIAAVNFCRAGLAACGEANRPVAANHLGMALTTLVMVSGEQERLTEAISNFDFAAEKWVSKPAASLRVQLNKASALSLAGRAKETSAAREIVNGVLPLLQNLDSQEDYIRSENIVADILLRLGEFEESEHACDEVLRLPLGRFRTEHARALFIKANVLGNKNKDPTRTIMLLREALSVGSSNAVLLYNIAKSLSDYGSLAINLNPALARSTLDEAILELESIFNQRHLLNSRKLVDTCLALSEAYTSLVSLELKPGPQHNMAAAQQHLLRIVGLYRLVLITADENSRYMDNIRDRGLHLPNFAEALRATQNNLYSMVRLLLDLPIVASLAQLSTVLEALVSSTNITAEPDLQNLLLSTVIHTCFLLYSKIGTVVGSEMDRASTIAGEVERLLSALGVSPDEYQHVLVKLGEKYGVTFSEMPMSAQPAAASPQGIISYESRVSVEHSPKIDWPTETYSASKEAGRGGAGIVAYLERVWEKIIAAGQIDLPTLRKVDPSAVKAMENLRLRRDPKTKERLQVPAHLNPPTIMQVNDRMLERAEIPIADATRLRAAARRRGRQLGR